MRWSDGSRQLLLGDEVLDVAEQDVANDHHYLFVRHQGLIQARAPLPASGQLCLCQLCLTPTVAWRMHVSQICWQHSSRYQIPGWRWLSHPRL